MKTKTQRLTRGFTLIELLLVMVILAILAGVVVLRITNNTERAKIVRAQADVHNLGIALDNFEINAGRYPTNDEGLQALVEQPSGVDEWTGPYIKQANPTDPWNHPYAYRCPPQFGFDYDLYSFGPDGQEGTSDDIGNWTTSSEKSGM